jgi:PAS domain-containing protein
MRFIEPWHTELMALYALGWKGRDKPVAVPIDQLNSLLQAAAPGVVATARGASSDASVPWLYAREEVPADVVTALVNTWVMGLRPEPEHEDAVLRVRDSLGATAPEWTPDAVDLSAAVHSPGGTAEPDRRLYRLLPELLAARIAACPFRSEGEDLWFRVVGSAEGTELVSWPPRTYVRSGRTWFYSGCVTITVHTVPFAERFRVHVSTGIRRWMSGEPVRLAVGRGATVLLDAELPWLSGAGHTPRLVGNVIRYDPQIKRIAWRRRSLVRILPDLDVMRSYPAPEELLANPDQWLRGRKGISAGIVYSTALGKHEVGDGLMPVERARLDKWAEDSLRPWLRRVPDLTRAALKSKPVLRPKVDPKDDVTCRLAEQRAARERRAALAAALDGEPLEIDVVWQYLETRTQLITSLCELLGLPQVSSSEQVHWLWESGPLRIRVHATELGALSSVLEVGRQPGKSRAHVLTEAIKRRRSAVRAHFRSEVDPAKTVGLAVVELDGRDGFPVTDSDPKFAIRLGCADAGRLSQFIQVPDESTAELAIRARSAWLDGFRQLGAVTTPPHQVGTDLTVDPQYVALWMVRRRVDGPTRRAHHQLVTLRVRPADGVHRVQGWDEENKEWIPYPRFLLRMAQNAGIPVTDPVENTMSARRRSPTLREQQQEAEQRIRSVLFQLRDRPTLLLVNAGNMRKSWPWLCNGAMVRDMIRFGEDRPQRLAVLGPDLRLVQVRDRNSREEVPQWYAHKDDEGSPGFSLGVWQPIDAAVDNRVFASTADVPASAGKVKRGLLKLVPSADYPHAPSIAARNPQYLEITVVGCLSEAALAVSGRDDVLPDKPAAWAALTHQLRFVDDYVPLSRPLPLHLAKLVEEYVLPTEAASPAADESTADLLAATVQ